MRKTTNRGGWIGIVAGLLALAVLGALASCKGGARGGAEGTGEERLQVVATVGMIADVAQSIAGEHAEVTALMGPGVDPHLYKASESDVRKLDGADLVLYNGLHLEGKMGDILEKMGRGRPVVAVAEEVPEEKLRHPSQYEGNPDPHVWFDVQLWITTIDPIVEQLSALDPAHADEFRASGDAYRQQLEELDAWVVEQVATIPEQQRVLVTAHDAFGYFGRRYGFEVVGIQGLSTASEAGLGDVDRVVDLVVERELKAIFVESSVPQRTVDSVVSGVAGKGHTVAIGGELYSDAMGAAETPEGTYAGMVRHNVETIAEALR